MQSDSACAAGSGLRGSAVDDEPRCGRTLKSSERVSTPDSSTFMCSGSCEYPRVRMLPLGVQAAKAVALHEAAGAATAPSAAASRAVDGGTRSIVEVTAARQVTGLLCVLQARAYLAAEPPNAWRSQWMPPKTAPTHAADEAKAKRAQK
jgi:hypothetical protein